MDKNQIRNDFATFSDFLKAMGKDFWDIIQRYKNTIYLAEERYIRLEEKERLLESYLKLERFVERMWYHVERYYPVSESIMGINEVSPVWWIINGLQNL